MTEQFDLTIVGGGIVGLATALEVSMADLVQGSSRTLDDEIAELMQDDFITQVVEHLDKLDTMQRSSLLSQVRDLSTRPNRTVAYSTSRLCLRP